MIKDTNTLVETYRYISLADDALDGEAPDFETRWGHYIDGLGEPPVKDGEQPTVFVLRHLSSIERKRVQALKESGGEAMLLEACRLGLVGVENFAGQENYEFKRESDRRWGCEVSRVTEKEINRLPPLVIDDLGTRIMLAGLPRPN